MITNYIKIAWRNIWRNKLHSSINIAGLAVAFSICTVLFLVAYFQLSFDSFHKDSEQIFKTSRFTNSTNRMETSSQMPLPLMPALKEDISDIEAAVRIQRGIREFISYNGKSIERSIIRTDPDFFNVFNFPVLSGNRSQTLNRIQDIALTKSTADALFGAEDPIGKEISMGQTGVAQSFTVSAVMADCPRNTSIRFDALARIESHPDYSSNQNNWGNNLSNLFVKIAKQSNSLVVEDKLVAFSDKYYTSEIAQLKAEHTEAISTREVFSFNLRNIEDIHFSGERSVSILLIYALIGLGVFILLIACFNFVNLNLANSFRRSREVGVRKSLGALKGQLFTQLWGEALVLYFMGFVLGMLLAYQLIPIFNASFDANIGLSTLFEPSFLAIMFGIFLLVTLIAGGYPALRMAGLGIVDVLKGKTSTKKTGGLSKSLLVGQFAISTLLICVSLIAYQQLDFLRQKPIGFDKEQVISIPVGSQQDGRMVLTRMRNELANDPNILSISGTASNMGRGRDKTTSRTTSGWDYNNNQISSDRFITEYDFLKTLEIPILKGRDFSRNFVTDAANAVIVSENFVKAMNEPEPIGKYIGGSETELGSQIIGVIPDFYLHSPSEEVLPIALLLSETEAINYIFLKVQGENPQATMDYLTTVWSTAAENTEFRGSFLNENLQAWYEGERFMTSIFGIASGIAIFLSCLGLFALSLMVLELRTKEIGIRKVMGASINSIVSMISVYFLKLVLISLLIALPLAWYAMSTWLDNYVYRIELNPSTFLLVGLIVTAVALLTVSYHTIKVALMNPVKSLKSE